MKVGSQSKAPKVPNATRAKVYSCQKVTLGPNQTPAQNQSLLALKLLTIVYGFQSKAPRPKAPRPSQGYLAKVSRPKVSQTNPRLLDQSKALRPIQGSQTYPRLAAQKFPFQRLPANRIAAQPKAPSLMLPA
jgi:hypothetical protein